MPPYIAPALDGDRLRGRGACDAKGIAAAMLVAADNLATAGEQRVDLLFVVGEEKGSDGARAANRLARDEQVSRQRRADREQAGQRREGIAARHRAHAGSRRALGLRASRRVGDHADARRCCRRSTQLDLPTDDVLGATTVNIGTLHGGTEANIVPALGRGRDDVSSRRRRRARASSRSSSGRKGRAELEFGSYIPAQHFHTIPGFEVAPVAYTSDIPLLGRWGTPLLFGPGSIHVAHTPDEFIDVDELRAAVDVV